MPPRVVVTRRLLAPALDRLAAAGLHVEVLGEDASPDHDVLVDAARGASAIICLLSDRLDDAVFAAGAPTLRVVANVAVGVDNVDVAAADARGIVVTNTPGVLDAATADLAMFLVLAVRRRVLDAMAQLRDGQWRGFALDRSLGNDLAGSTLGLVGYGRIGRRVAARAKAFDMVVLHHARTPTGAPGFVAQLDELLVAADVVSLHLPLTATTRGLLDARRLALIGADGALVNTSRGLVIDEVALCEALETRRLGGAGLDVFATEPDVSHRLLACPNLVATPHIGSATWETRAAMCELAVDAVLDVLAGRRPPNRVAPEGPLTPPGEKSGTRG